MITKDITIEDLVEDYPFAEEFLRVRGIKCIRCGEPIWGTLETACKEKNFSDEQIEEIVRELNRLAENPDNIPEKFEPPVHIDVKKLNPDEK
jgi:iron-sulfur cluster repair protein YtfE (RIC family)